MKVSNPITGLPPIDSNVTVRLIEGMIVTGVVTGHGKKDGKPTFDFEYDHRTPEGRILKASKWAWPEQVQRNLPKFQIVVTETYTNTYEVEAEVEDQAINAAATMSVERSFPQGHVERCNRTIAIQEKA